MLVSLYQTHPTTKNSEKIPTVVFFQKYINLKMFIRSLVGVCVTYNVVSIKKLAG